MVVGPIKFLEIITLSWYIVLLYKGRTHLFHYNITNVFIYYMELKNTFKIENHSSCCKNYIKCKNKKLNNKRYFIKLVITIISLISVTGHNYNINLVIFACDPVIFWLWCAFHPNRGIFRHTYIYISALFIQATEASVLCTAGQIAPQYVVPFAITASQIGSVAKQCKNIVVGVPEDNTCLKFFWVFKVVFFKSLLENPKKIWRFIAIFFFCKCF